MRLGCDPEVFLQDNVGKPISVIGYIKADKWHPLQIPDMPKGFTLQEDNVALEYGIPPAASAEEFISHIRAVMAKSQEWLPGLSFSKLSAITFPEDQMNHPAAHIFGCEPDFNAWTKEVNFPPDVEDKFLRSAGGHVHIEPSGKDEIKDPTQITRNCDLFLGIPSLFMDDGDKRRLLYGKPGAHRVKPYGVEYRVLSNFWIFEDKYIDWVWRNSQRAVLFKEDLSKYAERIISTINNNDKKAAKRLVKEFNLEVV